MWTSHCCGVPAIHMRGAALVVLQSRIEAVPHRLWRRAAMHGTIYCARRKFSMEYVYRTAYPFSGATATVDELVEVICATRRSWSTGYTPRTSALC